MSVTGQLQWDMRQSNSDKQVQTNLTVTSTGSQQKISTRPGTYVPGISQIKWWLTNYRLDISDYTFFPPVRIYNPNGYSGSGLPMLVVFLSDSGLGVGGLG